MIRNLPECMQQAYFVERAILSALNADIDELHDFCISKLSGTSKAFLSVDTAISESGYQDHLVPKEYLNTINLSGDAMWKHVRKRYRQSSERC